MSLYKKYETFHKFSSKFATKHILFGISSPKDFLCKISLSPEDPSIFVISASPNAPYFENRDRTPTSILYSSAPGI